MPGKGIRNAVYKRGGGKGQSSRFYNIYGKVVKPTDPTGFKGGQGWTAPKPQIGSMLSLGIMKQNRNAGGNNVCQPGPKPKKSSTSNDSTLKLVPGTDVVDPGAANEYGFTVLASWDQPGFLSPQSLPTVPGTEIKAIIYNRENGTFGINIDFPTTAPELPTDSFSTVSFVNSDNGTSILYNTSNLGDGNYQNQFPNTRGRWKWVPFSSTGQGALAEKAFWEAAVEKNIKVGFDASLAIQKVIATGTGTATTFETGTFGNNNNNNNNDCNCRGPLAQCPCRKGGC